MESLLVSACLLGADCKYSGGNNLCPAVLALRERYHLVPVCPEQLGGLPTPREPAERCGGRVVTKSGRDVTAAFRKGAEQALFLARSLGCRRAILKARSPSCGKGPIYDGSFTGTLAPAAGLAAERLAEQGIRVFSEEELEALSAPGGPA